MTSRNLFFNLLKEDVKRRAWVIALNALVLFFVLPVAIALTAGEDAWNYESRMETAARMTENMAVWFSAGNGLMIFLAGLFAVLCCFSGFSYLNSRKKVDFYHSLPIKRGMLFSVYYINGIVMFVLVYLVNLLLALGIAAVNGADMAKLMPVAWTGFAVHTMGFLIIYAAAAVAALLTGNILIGFLGTAVFFAYCPAVAMLVKGFFSTWLRTCGDFQPYTGTDWFDLIMHRCSPVTAYTHMISSARWGDGRLTVLMIGTLAAAAVLTAISLTLHRLRPSESGGKAMAFKRTEPVIRILLTIPAALAGAMIFGSFRNSFGWAVFGLLCAGLITHCIIEIIYHFDFRKLFAHAGQMGICLAVSLLILITFKYDLLGYDTYEPSPASVESAAVQIYSLDDWVSYGKVEKDPDYRWSYGSAANFIYTHMKVTDPAAVLRLADAGIAYNSQLKKSNEDTVYISVNILYQLKNGRRVGRSYRMPLNSARTALEALYVNPDYKTGVFPLLSQLPEETAGAFYQEQNHITRLEIGKDYGKEAELRELLCAYQEDLKDLSIETRTEESPVGMIQFMDLKQYEAVADLKNRNKSSAYDLEQRCYYPVYPSFYKTIDLLKQCGVNPGTLITADQVDQVVITNYSSRYQNQKDNTTRGNDSYTITEKDQIAAVMTALIPMDYADMNILNPTDSYFNVTVTVGSGPGKEDYPYRMDISRMPEFLKQRMN